MTLRKKLGRLIPYPAIHAGRKLVHLGLRRCEVCASPVRSRIDMGYGHPVLERLQVVGGMRRKADACPVCHSGCRERLLLFYLERHGFARLGPGMIAHFAPEKGLAANLRKRFGRRYRAFDLEPARYRHLRQVEAADLECLPIEDASVSLFICNHVIEHVYDLPKCLSEVRRVLADEGIAFMQVPLALGLDQTIDGGQNMSADERVRIFGQHDHVRLFTVEGYQDSLQQAGFDVEVYRPFDDDDALATSWEIDPFEVLFVIRRGT